MGKVKTWTILKSRISGVEDLEVDNVTPNRDRTNTITNARDLLESWSGLNVTKMATPQVAIVATSEE